MTLIKIRSKCIKERLTPKANYTLKIYGRTLNNVFIFQFIPGRSALYLVFTRKFLWFPTFILSWGVGLMVTKNLYQVTAFNFCQEQPFSELKLPLAVPAFHPVFIKCSSLLPFQLLRLTDWILVDKSPSAVIHPNLFFLFGLLLSLSSPSQHKLLPCQKLFILCLDLSIFPYFL